MYVSNRKKQERMAAQRSALPRLLRFCNFFIREGRLPLFAHQPQLEETLTPKAVSGHGNEIPVSVWTNLFRTLVLGHHWPEHITILSAALMAGGLAFSGTCHCPVPWLGSVTSEERAKSGEMMGAWGSKLWRDWQRKPMRILEEELWSERRTWAVQYHRSRRMKRSRLRCTYLPLHNRPPKLGAFNQHSFLWSLMVWGTHWAQLGGSGSGFLMWLPSARGWNWSRLKGFLTPMCGAWAGKMWKAGAWNS